MAVYLSTGDVLQVTSLPASIGLRLSSHDGLTLDLKVNLY